MSKNRRTTVPSRIRPLDLRAVMGRETWHAPKPFGPAGWKMLAVGNPVLTPVLGQAEVPYVEGPPIGTIIVTQGQAEPDLAAEDERYDATEWIHASMSWVHRVPTYDELCLLKRAVWGDRGEAYQIHARADRHVNLHPYALHLWGRADGKPVLPDFGKFGTI